MVIKRNQVERLSNLILFLPWTEFSFYFAFDIDCLDFI